MVVGNLPEHFQAHNLKKISGSRHVIEATVEEDNFRGICKGTGRIKIRLNHGETVDSVKNNFLKQGITVKEFEQDPRKKPIVTGLPKEQEKDIKDPRMEKINELLTKTPDVFGNTRMFVPKQKN